MPVIPKTQGPSRYAAAATEFVWTPSTPAGDVVQLGGNDILLIRNVSGAAARTFTVTSSPDAYGRLGHITAQSLAFGEYAILGPIPLSGWANPTTGQLQLASEHADIEYAVISLSS